MKPVKAHRKLLPIATICVEKRIKLPHNFSPPMTAAGKAENVDCRQIREYLSLRSIAHKKIAFRLPDNDTHEPVFSIHPAPPAHCR
jgi:hypothetical protein